MESEPQRDRLPFEPNKKRQKPTKAKPTPASATAKKSDKLSDSETAKKSESKQTFTKEEMAIPPVVSNRMIRRVAVFCGGPTALGMATFVLSYVIVSQHLFKLPTYAVLLASLGFFGLGVLGLSYGLLSASWDEEIVGSKLGWDEFKVNWGRMVAAWRSTQKKNV